MTLGGSRDYCILGIVANGLLDGKFDMKVKNNVFAYIYAMYDAHIATLCYMFYCYDRETSNIITP